jgi:hypothetical protein
VTFGLDELARTTNTPVGFPSSSRSSSPPSTCWVCFSLWRGLIPASSRLLSLIKRAYLYVISPFSKLHSIIFYNIEKKFLIPFFIIIQTLIWFFEKKRRVDDVLFCFLLLKKFKIFHVMILLNLYNLFL